ncbi:4-hydroxy-tetrahydrodipicolinate reductase [Halovivax gelatinilyticus]|uniref:4-hydroxy-tetrahydrodipicolinate reductase n=1 Tax=Halovivax gelatinilyticus TaxID=2961597 RepID=UPI0020CA6765|nr:4-hydroxy-tetrahydrodipicolinate reductase [Halovivax gelatinilyticus]
MTDGRRSIRLGVTGATGRMGREVLAAASDRPAFEVVLAVARSPPDEPIEAVEIESADAFDRLVADREPHVVVDFTAPVSTATYADACADAGVAFVTGTTGLDDSHERRLRAASERIPLLRAANFSRGIAVLDALCARAVRSLPDYDIELVETHHAGKRDAPSGTALSLLETVESERDASERVHGRVGDSPRDADEIGVHSIRAGAIAGEHEVVLAGDHEELRLTHRAGDRGVFAAGALDAAAWLAGRDPGRYAFAEVIET